MAIEINLGQKSTAVEGLSSNIGGQSVEDKGVGLSGSRLSSAAPVLGGENVKVTSGAISDLEKLVAQLKNESENTRTSVAQQRIAVLQTVLDSMEDRISEAQAKALVEIETKSGEIDELNADIARMEADKAAAQARSIELDIKIKELENAVKNEIKNGEDHRKQVEELKRQKAEEDQKVADLTNAIASAQAKIATLNSEIASLSASIGAATLSEVAAAVKAAAGDVAVDPEKVESVAESEKREQKAESLNPLNIIRDSLDRIYEDITRTIEENLEIKA